MGSVNLRKRQLYPSANNTQSNGQVIYNSDFCRVHWAPNSGAKRVE